MSQNIDIKKIATSITENIIDEMYQEIDWSLFSANFDGDEYNAIRFKIGCEVVNQMYNEFKK